jgi:hypothetical protein
MEAAAVRQVPMAAPRSRRRQEPPKPTPPTRVGMTLDPNDLLSRAMLKVGGVLGRYHQHRVLHLERLGDLIGSGRRAVLVGNHVLDVIDPFLFVRSVYERYGVVPRTMGHPAWFSTPGLRDLTQRYKVIRSRDPDSARQALREDGLLMLFPGAVREAAMRDFHREPYTLKWEDRYGFLRLALEEDAEILFFAAVGNEQLYYQSSLPVPDTLVRYFANGDRSRYEGLRLSFGVLGPHLVPGLFPFPAQITHVVSRPIDLGNRARAARTPAAFAELHRLVQSECQTFLDRAVAEHGQSATLVNRGVRASHALLRRLGL